MVSGEDQDGIVPLPALLEQGDQVPEALAAFNAALRGGFASRLAGAFRFAPEALRVPATYLSKAAAHTHKRTGGHCGVFAEEHSEVGEGGCWPRVSSLI